MCSDVQRTIFKFVFFNLYPTTGFDDRIRLSTYHGLSPTVGMDNRSIYQPIMIPESVMKPWEVL